MSPSVVDERRKESRRRFVCAPARHFLMWRADGLGMPDFRRGATTTRTDPMTTEVAKLIIEFAKQGKRDPEPSSNHAHQRG
jgi:hypothetical protein